MISIYINMKYNFNQKEWHYLNRYAMYLGHTKSNEILTPKSPERS